MKKLSKKVLVIILSVMMTFVFSVSTSFAATSPLLSGGGLVGGLAKQAQNAVDLIGKVSTGSLDAVGSLTSAIFGKTTSKMNLAIKLTGSIKENLEKGNDAAALKDSLRLVVALDDMGLVQGDLAKIAKIVTIVDKNSEILEPLFKTLENGTDINIAALVLAGGLKGGNIEALAEELLPDKLGDNAGETIQQLTNLVASLEQLGLTAEDVNKVKDFLSGYDGSYKDLASGLVTMISAKGNDALEDVVGLTGRMFGFTDQQNKKIYGLMTDVLDKFAFDPDEALDAANKLMEMMGSFGEDTVKKFSEMWSYIEDSAEKYGFAANDLAKMLNEYQKGAIKNVNKLAQNIFGVTKTGAEKMTSVVSDISDEMEKQFGKIAEFSDSLDKKDKMIIAGVGITTVTAAVIAILGISASRH